MFSSLLFDLSNMVWLLWASVPLPAPWYSPGVKGGLHTLWLRKHIPLLPPITISGATQGASVSPCANKAILRILFGQAFHKLSAFIGDQKRVSLGRVERVMPLSLPHSLFINLLLSSCFWLFFLSEEPSVSPHPQFSTYCPISLLYSPKRLNKAFSHKDGSVPKRNSSTSC